MTPNGSGNLSMQIVVIYCKTHLQKCAKVYMLELLRYESFLTFTILQPQLLILCYASCYLPNSNGKLRTKMSKNTQQCRTSLVVISAGSTV